MTLLKAIEILTLPTQKWEEWTFDDWQSATKLGIEALTYIHLLRQTNPELVPALFHGETVK